MPRTRQELEEIERLTLAPYAQFSGDTRGRQYKEPPPEWRTHYQRDRDRVIHSRAFRRLEYKTQVFLNGTGDHLRTRLTHTIEVAAISRNIASALRLNTDLAETIALAHDLGHSPFGHKGETVLARLMKGHGGFEHNQHSLRIVEELEQKYPTFPGLNLSWEVREGLAKHHTAYDHPGRRKGFAAKNSSLEAQIANLADEITYYSHDLDDGLDSGLLSEKELTAKVRVWAQAARQVRKEYGKLPDESRRYFTIRTIIDMQIHDVVENRMSRKPSPVTSGPWGWSKSGIPKLGPTLVAHSHRSHSSSSACLSSSAVEQSTMRRALCSTMVPALSWYAWLNPSSAEPHGTRGIHRSKKHEARSSGVGGTGGRRSGQLRQ